MNARERGPRFARRGLCALALSVCAARCAGRPSGSGRPPESAAQDAGTLAVVGEDGGVRRAIAEALPDRLRRRGVTEDNFSAFTVLYTWTTPAQIERLRNDHQLLVSEANLQGKGSPYDRELLQFERFTNDAGRLARLLLRDPRLLHQRYAWVSPFATVRGLTNRTYGNALVRIELRPEAWTARFSPDEPHAMTVWDRAGTEVPLSVALRTPERIAAVYHVRRTAPIPYREFIVCSAAMVARWAVATQELRDFLDEDLAILHGMSDALALQAIPSARAARRASARWGHGADLSGLDGLWSAALAFDNAYYRLDLREFQRTVVAIEAWDPVGEPFTGP